MPHPEKFGHKTKDCYSKKAMELKQKREGNIEKGERRRSHSTKRRKKKKMRGRKELMKRMMNILCSPPKILNHPKSPLILLRRVKLLTLTILM